MPRRSWNRGQGKAIAYARSLVGHAGDECIMWPFSRTPNGYGQCSLNGRIHTASRIICELNYGAPPTDRHEAAHTCGRGRDGCVNPNHLVWKTPEENAADMAIHGTARKKGSARRILSSEQVAEIRVLAKDTPRLALAERFGVKRRTIDSIVTGRDRPIRPLRHRSRGYPEPQRSEMIAKAKRLRSLGVSYRNIADTIGVSKNTAKTFSQKREQRE